MREANASKEYEQSLDKLWKVTVPMLRKHGRKVEAMAKSGHSLARKSMSQHDALVKEFDPVLAECQHTDAVALVAEIENAKTQSPTQRQFRWEATA